MKQPNKIGIFSKLQKIYDDNFSSLGFNEAVMKDNECWQFVFFLHLQSCAAFDYEEILKCYEHNYSLKALMRVRLLDALLTAKDMLNKDIKRLKEI